MSAHDYDPAGIDCKQLSKEVEAAFPRRTFRLRVGASARFDFDGDLVPREIPVLDQAVADHKAGATPIRLADSKATRCVAVDRRTRELIAEGFTHSGRSFSLSASAQRTWNGMAISKADLAYPVEVNTIDDTDKISLADAAAVQALYGAALAAIRGHLDSGTSLKDDVRAAADVSAVEAVEDTR